MKLDQSSIRSIERILGEEIAACEEYLKVVQTEQDLVVKFDSAAVTAAALRRDQIAERMAILRDRRVELVSSLAGDKITTLSQLIERGCQPGDRKKLLGLVNKLRAAVDGVEAKSREFAQIVEFSMGLVNGSISILWSATQNVTRCYNAFGGVKESFQPVPVRDGSLLGKA